VTGVTSSWVPVPAGSPFPVQNLPYGVFAGAGEDRPRIGVAIGDYVLDLAVLDPTVLDPAVLDPAVLNPAVLDLAEPAGSDPAAALRRDEAEVVATFRQPSLNGLLAAGPAAWSGVRERVTALLTDDRHRSAVEPALLPADRVRMLLPFEVADYVDFYSSEQHASNAGRIFRSTGAPLQPNWKQLPVGYHGRAGTVVVSGTPVVRPCGQRRPAGADTPTYGPSTRLDFEAEVGFVVGVPSPLGERVPTTAWRDHVFGVVLVNDWSARDIQTWESAPLGPFLAKSFATSMSPWVVPLAALEPALVAPPAQHPLPLPYLRPAGAGLALDLEISLNGHVLSRPPFATGMYWTPAQQLAHLTVNGASLRTGDLYASGTVSGSNPDQRGSLLELSWNGETPVTLPDGTTRAFLDDGDTVSITGRATGADGVQIGLGTVTGTVRPAR
jgi:fumarylacetoacetase